MILDKSLLGRSILITGGSRGLGREMCLCLAKVGAKICFTASKESQNFFQTLEDLRNIAGSDNVLAKIANVTDSDAISGQDEPLTITINKNKEIFIGDSIIKAEALEIKLRAIANLNKESRIFIRADELLPYGEVMVLMSRIKKAGYNKVALLTKQKIEK